MLLEKDNKEIAKLCDMIHVIENRDYSKLEDNQVIIYFIIFKILQASIFFGNFL